MFLKYLSGFCEERGKDENKGMREDAIVIGGGLH